MVSNSGRVKKYSRKRAFPFFAKLLAALHLLLFFLLARCQSPVGDQSSDHRVSYLEVNVNSFEAEPLPLVEPSSQVFYRYTSVPSRRENVALLPLREPSWDGYQTLVSLRDENSSSLEGFRLALRAEREEERPRNLLGPSSSEFDPIFVAGVPVLPVTPIPEPSASLLIVISLLSLLNYRHRREV